MGNWCCWRSHYTTTQSKNGITHYRYIHIVGVWNHSIENIHYLYIFSSRTFFPIYVHVQYSIDVKRKIKIANSSLFFLLLVLLHQYHSNEKVAHDFQNCHQTHAISRTTLLHITPMGFFTEKKVVQIVLLSCNVACDSRTVHAKHNKNANQQSLLCSCDIRPMRLTKPEKFNSNIEF